jgi:hypothetical protein
VHFSADLTFANQDSGYVAREHRTGLLWFQDHLQRELTHWTGFGNVIVYPHLHVRNDVGGTCDSLPALSDEILVY